MQSFVGFDVPEDLKKMAAEKLLDTDYGKVYYEEQLAPVRALCLDSSWQENIAKLILDFIFPYMLQNVVGEIRYFEFAFKPRKVTISLKSSKFNVTSYEDIASDEIERDVRMIQVFLRCFSSPEQVIVRIKPPNYPAFKDKTQIGARRLLFTIRKIIAEMVLVPDIKIRSLDFCKVKMEASEIMFHTKKWLLTETKTLDLHRCFKVKIKAKRCPCEDLMRDISKIVLDSQRLRIPYTESSNTRKRFYNDESMPMVETQSKEKDKRTRRLIIGSSGMYRAMVSGNIEELKSQKHGRIRIGNVFIETGEK